MAIKKEKQGIQKLVGKRITLADRYGEELHTTSTLILRSVDDNWLELHCLESSKVICVNTRPIGIVAEHKEQP